MLKSFVLLILHKSFTLLIMIILHSNVLSHLFLVDIIFFTEFIFKLKKFSFDLFFTVFRDSLNHPKSMFSLIYVGFIKLSEKRISRRPICRKRLTSTCCDVNTLIVAVLISHPCFWLKLPLRSCKTLIINKWVYGELISLLFRHL